MITDFNQAPPERLPVEPVPNSPRRARAWAAELDRVPPEGAAQRLRAGLDALNDAGLAPGKRLRILSALEPLTESLLAWLGRKIQSRPLPLSPRGCQLFSLHDALCAASAAAYAAVIAETSWRLPGARGRIASAAVAALARLDVRALRTAEAYAPWPADIWRLAHGIYRHAEAAGAIDREIAPADAKAAPISPAGAYRRLLLFGAAEVASLPRGELGAIHRMLSAWQDAAVINRVGEGDREGSIRLAIDLGAAPGARAATVGDRGPVPWHYVDCDDPARLRVLDLTGVFLRTQALLEGRQKPSRSRSTPDPSKQDGAREPNAATLEELLTRWARQRSRGAQRVARDEAVEVVVSLGAITDRLRQVQKSAAAAASAAQASNVAAPVAFALEPKIAASASRRPDHLMRAGVRAADAVASAWDRVARGQLAAASATPTQAPSQMAPAQAEPAQWHLLDRSAEGFRLRCTGAGTATVGGLVALRCGDAPWRIGTVRWMRHDTADCFEIGVEIIADRVQPIEVRRTGGQRQRGQDPARGTPASDPVLLVPPAKGDPATLLVTANRFQEGEQIELVRNGCQRPVRLGRPCRSTSSYAQFALRAASR